MAQNSFYVSQMLCLLITTRILVGNPLGFKLFEVLYAYHEHSSLHKLSAADFCTTTAQGTERRLRNIGVKIASAESAESFRNIS